jgi:hypothetical protein
MLGAHVSRNKDIDRFADKRSMRVAKHPRQLTVDEHDCSERIDDDNAEGGRFDHAAQHVDRVDFRACVACQ